MRVRRSRDEIITLIDREAPIDENRLYRGAVRGIYRDNPLNKYHITKIFAFDDEIIVSVVEPKRSKR